MAKTILRVKSGTLTNTEISDLKEAGYVVIVAEDVDVVVVDITEAAKELALQVLYNADKDATAYSMREWFSRLLMNRIGTKQLG